MADSRQFLTSILTRPPQDENRNSWITEIFQATLQLKQHRQLPGSGLEGLASQCTNSAMRVTQNAFQTQIKTTISLINPYLPTTAARAENLRSRRSPDAPRFRRRSSPSGIRHHYGASAVRGALKSLAGESQRRRRSEGGGGGEKGDVFPSFSFSPQSRERARDKSQPFIRKPDAWCFSPLTPAKGETGNRFTKRQFLAFREIGPVQPVVPYVPACNVSVFRSRCRHYAISPSLVAVTIRFTRAFTGDCSVMHENVVGLIRRPFEPHGCT
ncbi:hypothetical protein ACLOJK_008057 [Asimina triloba]